MRTAFIRALCSAAAENDRIWLVTGDLGFSVIEEFADSFPTRFLNAGVAEQNMTGIAAGLAMTGLTVFTYSIANFPLLRCLEQVRNDICYHQLDVKIVSVGGGFAYGAAGMSHHGLEDLAIARAIPNLAVVAPGDPWQAQAATEASLKHPGPCFIRLGKAREPEVHASLPSEQRGQLVPVRPGRDALLLTTGGILDEAVKASQWADEHGIDIAVVSCPWLRPLDHNGIAKCLREFPLVVTVEEGQRTGGLGSAVAEVAASMTDLTSKLVRAGVPDAWIESCASQQTARSRFGLDWEGLGQLVIEQLTENPDNPRSIRDSMP